MVQSLPQTPSLLEMLGSGLGSGVSTGMQMLMPELIKERQLSKLSSILGGNQITSQQQGMPTQGMESETAQSQMSQIEKIATNPAAMAQLANINPKFADQVQGMYRNLLSKQKLQAQQEMTKTKLAFQETKDTRKDIDSAYKSAKDQNLILSRMEEIDKEGKTISPAMTALFDKLDIPISILRNPESEEFQKLSQNLMKGVTQYGNRILQVEFANFMKQIPTLLNSKEGRSRIIRNMKLLNQINLDTYETKKQILKENKGVPPLDLFDQVQERVQPNLEKIQSELSKPIKLQDRQSSENTVLMKDPAGNLREVDKKDAIAAQNAGYKLQQ